MRAKLPAWRTGGRNRHSRASDGCRCGRRSSIATGPGSASLDGRWRFSLAARPDAVPDGFTDAEFDDGGWAEVDVPGCWTMQGFDRPIYTNYAMPFRTFPPDVPDDNPTGCYRTRFTVPDEWRDRRVVLHVGAAESVVARVGERPRGRHEQGLAARSRVRRDGTRAVRREQHAGRRSRSVVRRLVRRGPGPVVARRHPPRGVPLQHAAHLPRRRARDRIARRRSGNRHARPEGRRRLRRSAADRRLDRRRARGGRAPGRR